MKTILTFLLMLFFATAWGANPSFQDFNSGQFGVAGNKVVVKSGVLLTNPVVSSGVITGNGSGLTNLSSQVWTNSAGVIQPSGVGANTNAVYIFPQGAVHIGTNTTTFWGGTYGETLVSFRDVSKGEPNYATLFLSVSSDSSGTINGQLEAYQSTNTSQLKLKAGANFGGDENIDIKMTPGSSYIDFTSGGTSVAGFKPSIADGSTPHYLDTTLAHTSGNLLELKNLATDKFVVAYDGSVTASGVFTGNASGLTNLPTVWGGISNNAVTGTNIIVDNLRTTIQNGKANMLVVTNGQVLTADGSATAPTFARLTDTDDGLVIGETSVFYRDGNYAVGMGQSGGQGIITLAAGTGATPLTHSIVGNTTSILIGNSSTTVQIGMYTNTIVNGVLVATNGIVFYQRETIPTNNIPASSASVTNWVLLNLTNTIASGGPMYVATNLAAAGSFLIARPTITVTTFP